MSVWSRFANLFRGDRVNRELDEELQSHIEEAIAHGRDPAEARRAFGSTLRAREYSRNVKLPVWLDALRADKGKPEARFFTSRCHPAILWTARIAAALFRLAAACGV
jgi:hypothetical protein